MEPFARTLAAARRGSDEAWEELYGELAPPLLGYLRSQGAAEPEDLLGEVFLQLVRDLPRFDGGERQFRAWAFTVAHHRLIDDRRHRGRRPVEPAPDEELERRAKLGDLEREALDRVRAEDIRRALAQLPGDQQSVLMLRVFGDLTVSEVARVLGKRPGAVKALQRRGLATLRRAISTFLGVPV